MLHLLAVHKETVFLFWGSFAVLESIGVHHIHNLKKKINTIFKASILLVLYFTETKIRSLLFSIVKMSTFFLDHMWHLPYVSISIKQIHFMKRMQALETDIHNSKLICYLSVWLWANVLITQSFIFPISKIKKNSN